MTLDAVRSDGGAFTNAVWTMESTAATPGALVNSWEDYIGYRTS